MPRDRDLVALINQLQNPELNEYSFTHLAEDDKGDDLDDPTVPDVIAELERLGINAPGSKDNDHVPIGPCLLGDAEADDDWHPYGTKTMFMLNLLDSLPRLRLSDDHIRLIIWRKTSQDNEFYANGPSSTFRLDWSNPLVRAHIRLYPETTPEVSEILQAEKAAPKVINTKDLDLYPHMWADWENTPYRHFYIREAARLHDGRYVLILRWIVERSTVYADVYELNHTTGLFGMYDPEVLRIPVNTLSGNCRDIEAVLGQDIRFDDTVPKWAARNHPVRETANGRPAFTLYAAAWSDDVSGNVSKQFNLHTNMYLANLNLPHEKLQQEFFIRFHSTSQHASSSEQFTALYKEAGPDCWIEAYDCALKEDIVFRVMPHIKPADNPQQSETCSHIGLKGNLFCRRCMVGGSAEAKETNEVLLTVKPGEPRTPDETERVVKLQLRLACRGEREAVEESQTSTGVKDRIAQFWIEVVLIRSQAEQKRRLTDKDTRDARMNSRSLKGDEHRKVKDTIVTAIQEETFEWLIQQPPHSYNAIPVDSPLRKDVRRGDHYNPLLGVPGVNVHRDTATEILHTYLIGEDKYIWHDTSHPWSKKEERLFAQRLQSSSVDGLSIPAIQAEYMVKYKNSLIGRHYKTLQQLAVFHLHDLCSPLIFDLWKSTGELGAMIWVDTILDMEQYLADLEILIANLLDIWALLDPYRIIVKAKHHVLSHLVADVRQFGPAILYSTEIFECWNSVFRICSVLSNRLAPSRDIAETLAGLETFKHIVSGGWWKTDEGGMVQAGRHVRAYLRSTPELQRRLGWVDPTSIQPGTVKLEAVKKRSVPVDTAPQAGENAGSSSGTASQTVESRVESGADERLKRCAYVISRSKDVCKRGSWVFYKHPQTQVVSAGRIVEVFLAPSSSSDNGSPAKDCAHVLIQPYTVLEAKDKHYNMPVLVRTIASIEQPAHDLYDRVCVAPEAVLFAFNAQHDCYDSKCAPTGTVPVRQERRETGQTRQVNEHVAKTDRYILNTHAIRNSALIRQTLPRNLTAPEPYIPSEDRTKRHHELAAQLQVSGPQKHADAKTRAAETRARNKTKNATAAERGSARAPTAAGTSNRPVPSSNTAGPSLANQDDEMTT
ncbi:uncharacterized protein C8Q71DRAFT_863691 [Rhodofomes roseus]|uniref:Uncharacterized protein n=1 Tax=Rhodofomes roseus TaxID=34475 RepID=A0ABQ8JYY8_9APHY|nr:uncharacterized protein C8Q71DRAFT_863691 [Rhodofomes roseus]KAH9828836.1 hypothetical protein C8Q71DRAFT_863691 [Rhodofomes roseus]